MTRPPLRSLPVFALLASFACVDDPVEGTPLIVGTGTESTTSSGTTNGSTESAPSPDSTAEGSASGTTGDDATTTGDDTTTTGDDTTTTGSDGDGDGDDDGTSSGTSNGSTDSRGTVGPTAGASSTGASSSTSDTGSTGGDDVELRITEIYAGLATNGEDGTEDWFELTNDGSSPVELSSLYYEDSSNDPTNGVQLPAQQLGAGEIVIVLISNDDADITTFQDIWGDAMSVIRVDGPSLGDGDTVNLYDDDSRDARLVADATYLESDITDTATMQVAEGGAISASVINVDGAYESSSFTNQNLGEITLIGSPGL